MILKLNQNKIKENSYNIYIVILSILILSMIMSPDVCMDGCLKGLNLFIKTLFPTLFPFLVLCNFMISLKGGDFYGKLLGPLLCKPLNLPKSASIVILLSFLCGYPIGAKYTCELYKKKQISFHIAENLLNIASNASPLFILGAISLVILKNTYYGLIVLASNYISCIIMGCLLRDNNINHYSKKEQFNDTKENEISFARAFSSSVDDAIKVTLKVGGLVVIFSVLNTMIVNTTLFSYLINKNYFCRIIVSFAMSILELTNGCVLIEALNIPIFLKIALVSFGVSFSGVCVLLQIHSFISKCGFSIGRYIWRKIIQASISFLLSIILYFIFLKDLAVSSLNSFYYFNYPLMYISICILLLCSIIIFMLKMHKNN